MYVRLAEWILDDSNILINTLFVLCVGLICVKIWPLAFFMRLIVSFSNLSMFSWSYSFCKLTITRQMSSMPSQIHSLASSEHCFHFNFVFCFARFEKWGRTDGHYWLWLWVSWVDQCMNCYCYLLLIFITDIL